MEGKFEVTEVMKHKKILLKVIEEKLEKQYTIFRQSHGAVYNMCMRIKTKCLANWELMYRTNRLDLIEEAETCLDTVRSIKKDLVNFGVMYSGGRKWYELSEKCGQFELELIHRLTWSLEHVKEVILVRDFEWQM